MRAVIYARVSGEDRGSLQTQIDMGREYATQHGYTIAGVYSEDWVSGASMEAPELQRVLDLAQNSGFDVLIVREMDRLARYSTENPLKHNHDPRTKTAPLIRGRGRRSYQRPELSISQKELHMNDWQTILTTVHEIIPPDEWWFALPPNLPDDDYNRQIKEAEKRYQNRFGYPPYSIPRVVFIGNTPVLAYPCSEQDHAEDEPVQHRNG